MTVRVLIAAHPARAAAAARLHDQTGGGIVYDPLPDAGRGALRTMIATLTHAERSQPTLILQDDAIPHPRIVEYAEQIHKRHTTRLAALYVGSVHASRKEILRAHHRDRRYVYLPLRHFIPTVALLWPAGYPAAFLEWITANPRREDRYQDDEAVKEWRCSQGRDHVHAIGVIPSLARHDNALPSLLNHGHHGPRDALIPWDEMPTGWEAGW